MDNEPRIEFNKNTEQSVFEKLDSLGLNYKYIENEEGKVIYTFFNVSETERGIFWLDAKGKKILFKSFHFDKEQIADIDPNNFFKSVREKFSDAEGIIYSCCSPDEARQVFQNIDPKPIIIGSGSSEYKTVYNSVANFITVSPV